MKQDTTFFPFPPILYFRCHYSLLCTWDNFHRKINKDPFRIIQYHLPFSRVLWYYPYYNSVKYLPYTTTEPLERRWQTQGPNCGDQNNEKSPTKCPIFWSANPKYLSHWVCTKMETIEPKLLTNHAFTDTSRTQPSTFTSFWQIFQLCLSPEPQEHTFIF